MKKRHKIQWSEDVVDNEHMNKKKSKSKWSVCVKYWFSVCCKFEKPHVHGSGSEHSDSDDDRNEYDRPSKAQKDFLK